MPVDVNFSENLYAHARMRMDDRTAIVGVVVSRIAHFGFTRYFVCGYNELDFLLAVKIPIHSGFGAGLALIPQCSSLAFPWCRRWQFDILSRLQSE